MSVSSVGQLLVRRGKQELPLVLTLLWWGATAEAVRRPPLIHTRSWHVALTSCLRRTSGLIAAARQPGAPASTWQRQLCRCRRSRRADVTESNRAANGRAASHRKLQLTQAELLAHYLLAMEHADGGHPPSTCQGCCLIL